VIVEHDVDLADRTTFHIAARAATVFTCESVEDVREALNAAPAARVLGGGSNVLVTSDLTTPLLIVALHERTEVERTESTVTVRFGAGVVWHEAVTWCVDQGWSGLENLALIPGTVGAAPIQNIGAYGGEQEACFVSCDAIDRERDNASVTFDRETCAFGYRDSLFKREAGRYVITHVTYRLQLNGTAHADYADVRNDFAHHGVTHPTIKNVFDAVVRIRTHKLPDPAVIGNAGSFFKNPVIARSQYQELLQRYPAMPHYSVNDEHVKVPAAWLIDNCGWKGHRQGDAGVHERQALVLVNHGTATGAQILDLAQRVMRSVKDAYDIDLTPEVNIWTE
jgi:UDP-N-acetylmuramate dehydrogenase